VKETRWEKADDRDHAAAPSADWAQWGKALVEGGHRDTGSDRCLRRLDSRAAHLFCVLVWPALEVPAEKAAHAPQERARQVFRVLHAGAAEMMAWSTRYEVDYGLRWDSGGEVWVAADGFAYDGERLYDYYAGQGEGGR
jgi:hypothetical protein